MSHPIDSMLQNNRTNTNCITAYCTIADLNQYRL